MSESGLRLRSVRFKDGRPPLRVLRKGGEAQQRIATRVRELVEIQGSDVAGFAFVAWGPDNSSVAALENFTGSRIPEIFAPDFVRNRLLAEKIEEWVPK